MKKFILKFIFSKRNRERKPGAAALFLVTFLLSGVSACLPGYKPSLTDTALRYDPLTIASDVAAKPGSMAWSSEGRLLAFIGKTVRIYDTISGEEKSFPVDQPYYLAWGRNDTLYALSWNEKGNSVLTTLDPKGSRVASLILDSDAAAVYPGSDPPKVVLLFTQVKHLSFGTIIGYTVSVHDTVTNTSKTIYRFSKTYMTKNPDISSRTAWIHAGRSPLDGRLMVMDHVQPPDATSYSKVNLLDPGTSEISEIAGRKTEYASASWSGDGLRAVISDADGHLEIRNVLGDTVHLDWSVAGIYPSWNPKGSRIYAGGYLIDSDGKNKEALLPGAVGSISQWSPDGTRLAVATGKHLLLFRNMHPSYAAPDGPLDTSISEQLTLLLDLASRGLISHREYASRRDNLIRKHGNEK